MKKDLIQRLHKSFEDCARQHDGVEYWLARELQELLGYTQWRNFETVIEKARTACANAGQAVDDHFADVSKMIDLGKGAQREVVDVELTRYACCLVAQNGDLYVPTSSTTCCAMAHTLVGLRRTANPSSKQRSSFGTIGSLVASRASG